MYPRPRPSHRKPKEELEEEGGKGEEEEEEVVEKRSENVPEIETIKKVRKINRDSEICYN